MSDVRKDEDRRYLIENGVSAQTIDTMAHGRRRDLVRRLRADAGSGTSALRLWILVCAAVLAMAALMGGMD